MKGHLPKGLVDPYKLLVVNEAGKLRVLYTPFKVICIIAEGLYLPGMWLYVDEVYGAYDKKIMYVIGGRPYPHSSFNIRINF